MLPHQRGTAAFDVAKKKEPNDLLKPMELFGGSALICLHAPCSQKQALCPLMNPTLFGVTLASSLAKLVVTGDTGGLQNVSDAT